MSRGATIVPAVLGMGWLLATLAGAGAGEGPVPPRVRVPPIRTPPAVDGVLSPGEWDGAFMGSGIARHGAGGMDAIQVRYGFAYDATRVYLAGQMETPPDRDLGVPSRRLARRAEDYHFEYLVDPFPGDPDKNWVQAMLYPMGEYKNLGYSQRIGGFVPYDVEWTYRDRWSNGWWTIEMSAPAEAFNRADLADGRVWGVLFAGLISTGPYYFSGTVGELFAKRDRYLKMVLDREAPVIQIPEIGDVSAGTLSPRIVVKNTTARDLDLTVAWRVKRVPNTAFSGGLDADTGAVAETQSQSLAVRRGDTGEARWSVAVPTDAKTTAWLLVSVADASGRGWYYDGIYRLDKPRPAKWTLPRTEPPAPVMMEAYLYPYVATLKAVVDLGGLEDPGRVAEVRVAAQDSLGRDIAAGATRAFAQQAAEVALALPPDLAVGTYGVKAVLADGKGQTITTASDTFTRQRFEFERNRIGVSDRVLYPWTPVACRAIGVKGQGSEGGTPRSRGGSDGAAPTGRGSAAAPPAASLMAISVWNRTYTLGKGGFPDQIETAGQPVLAGPVRLVEIAGGKAAEPQGSDLRLVSRADHAVEVAACATGREAVIEVALRAEYDGMLRYEVSVSGRPGARLDGLDLVIPLRAERAQYLHAAGDGCRSNYSHALRPGRGRVWDSTEIVNWVMPVQWLAYLWLGDAERGLCWWADSAEGWTLPRDRQTPVVEILRKGDTVEAIFHILSRPAPVLWKDATPRRLVFAFEATPMKPRPAWARDIGLCDPAVTGQKGPRFNWIGWSGWAFVGQEKDNDPASGRYTFAYRRPINAAAEEALRRSTAAVEAGGRHTLIYTDMRCVALVGDIEKAYAWEWNVGPNDHRKATITAAPQNHTLQVNATASRADYDLWCFQRLMDAGVRYFYFDELQNEGQINPLAGLGYRDEDGRWMPTMRLFAYRELWKRLYTLMQERGQREPIIVMHNTSTTYAGPMAFCTTTWDFEECNTDPNARHLTKFGMDYLITEAMGHQYGFAASTLGPGGKFEAWIKPGDTAAETAAARHWMGVHMTLDMNPYLTSHAVVQAGLALLRRVGWNEPDCEWVPYWKALAEKLYRYAPGPEARVYVSLYRRGRQVLLIFLNDTRDPLVVRWEPARGLAPEGPLRDAEQEAACAPEKGVFSVPVGRYDYRAFLFTPAAAGSRR